MACAPEELSDWYKEHEKFSVDLYKEMSQDNENLVFCPISVFATLCMLGAGAHGNTAAQLAKSLKLSSVHANSEVHKSFRSLIIALESVNSANVEIIIDTTLFLATGYSLKVAFAKTLSDNYFTSAQYADFTNKSEAAKIMNAWIAKETKDRIKDLITENLFNDNTRLVLTNAVYMKGFWQRKFAPENTMPHSFYLLNGSVRTVDMMHQEGNFLVGYSEKLNTGILEMPYKGLEFSMDIILPDNSKAFSKLEKCLDGKCLETLLNSFAVSSPVDVWLPRFQAEVSASLHEVLPKLGIVDLFSSQKANLSGVCEESLFVSVMLHKTFIVVDEEGSEATASTVAVVQARSLPMQFQVDRPFLYFIKHNKSGAILFIGRMTSPPESSASSS